MPINSTTGRVARRAPEETVALYIKNPAVAFIAPGITAPPKRKAKLAVRNHRRRKPVDRRNAASAGFADTKIVPMKAAPGRAALAPRKAPKTKTAAMAVMPVGGSAQKIDSPIRDIMRAADLEMNGRSDPATAGPWRRFIRNALKPAAQRFAGFTFASTARAVYRLMQATLVVMAAMTMIGFGRTITNEPPQHDEQIAQLQKQLQVLAEIDSVRQERFRRIVVIIDRFNPKMNSALKLNLAGEIYAMSQRYPQLEIELICAVITHESAKSWNPEVVSFAGAMGLMQLLPSTAEGLAQQEGIAWTSAENILFNPIYNVQLGCRYLASLIARFGLEGGLAGYNGGPVQAGRWLRQDNALHPETASYVPQVMKKYREFQQAQPQKSAKTVEARDFPKG